jgi:hypothetical protein
MVKKKWPRLTVFQCHFATAFGVTTGIPGRWQQNGGRDPF